MLSDIHNRHPKTIMIVDDEAIIRDLCRRALKDYRVIEAADGEEALALFERGGVDLILTDVMMPKMGGLDLLKRLKEIEPTIVVVIMTGFAEKEIILKALKADADDFITKPLNLLQLKTAVNKSLVKKALKEEIANLKSLDLFKTNFLSIVSHKFRTPITTISLFLQNFAGGVYDPEDETFRHNVSLIFEEARYLERLVADLLTFSRVMDTNKGLRLERCHLKTIIPTIFTESQEIAGNPGISASFDFEQLPPLLLDKEKITFAIRQVIDNAYKFSGTEGTVTVSLKFANGGYKIIVEDTGIGIAKEDLPKIFEKFYQVDSSHTGQIRGFGLGLYYAREFIRMHDGSITIDSEPGRGTRVTITLPPQES
ncbi:MAG TPA: response regulator [Geobacteraceae bacterium]|nr:response regulator [Geobacteraceae bacterium]